MLTFLKLIGVILSIALAPITVPLIVIISLLSSTHEAYKKGENWLIPFGLFLFLFPFLIGLGMYLYIGVVSIWMVIYVAWCESNLPWWFSLVLTITVIGTLFVAAGLRE